MSEDVARTEIGPNSLVTGEIDASEDVVVFGRVEGSIRSTTAVIVEEGGLARAAIGAANVLIAGSVVGNVHATERIEITEKGRVLGDLSTPRLVMAAGGAVKGRVTMTGAGEAAPAVRTPPAQKTYAARTATAAAASKKPVPPPRREPVTAARPKPAPAPAPDTDEAT
jgi:cytoskeletal protein CcmA (bactofilin family)